MRKALANWVNLNDNQSDWLAKIFSSLTVEARQDILLPHTSLHEIYFVCDGLLRFYYLSDEDVESNKDFVDLYEQDPVFERLERKFAEWLLIRKKLRMRSLLQLQAKPCG